MPNIITSILLGTFLTVQPIAQAVGSDELTYLIIAEQAEPFQINDPVTLIQSGVVTDIVNTIVQRKPLIMKQQIMPFKRYLYEMQQQSYPNWISYGSPAWRVESIAYLQNKRLSKQPLFTVNHIAVSIMDEGKKTTAWPNLQHKTVILLKGFIYEGLDTLIEKHQLKVLEVNSHKSALLALQNHRGDLFIEMESRILYSLKQHQIDPANFQFTDINDTVPAVDIHLSFGDGVPQQLIDWIDLQILTMQANGEILDIINQYQ